MMHATTKHNKNFLTNLVHCEFITIEQQSQTCGSGTTVGYESKKKSHTIEIRDEKKKQLNR